jgi:hypothetical protein
MNAAGDIAINRLHIRASKRDAQAITSDLLNGSWSVADHEHWLFIRNISIASNTFGIRQHASEAVNSAISQAVDGRLSGAASANAVRFQSYTEMLAYLLRDLADGSAIQRWYWQRWRYLMTETRSQALARVLWENAEYLGAVVEQLIAIDRLGNIWRELTHHSAQQIIHQLQSVTPAAVSDTSMTALPASAASVASLLTRILRSNTTVLHAWAGPLAAIGTTDNRFRLAAMITGMHYCPLYVVRDQELFIETFAGVLRHLYDGASQASDKNAGTEQKSMRLPRMKTTDTVPGTEYRQIFDIRESNEQDHVVDKYESVDHVEFERKISGAAVNRQSPTETRIRRAFEFKQSTVQSNTEPDEEVIVTKGSFEQQGTDNKRQYRCDDGELGISGDAFTTQWGGLFYLINAIRDDTCQAILTGADKNDYASGWIWLYDLARCMGADIDDSLLVFIAAQCGFRAVDELLSLPALPEIALIEAIMSARYRNQDLWNESLIHNPAYVDVTASHVDVFYSLQSVRLPVRLAGLDVNPGWVPWLGRVVSFHYRQSVSLPFSANSVQ